MALGCTVQSPASGPIIPSASPPAATAPRTQPGDAFLLGRWNTPASTLDPVIEWTRTPLDWRRSFFSELRSSVRLDRPIYFGGAADPDRARPPVLVTALTPWGSGMALPRPTLLGTPLPFCEATTNLLACGAAADHPRELGPVLGEMLGAPAPAGTLELEVRLAPIRGAYGQSISARLAQRQSAELAENSRVNQGFDAALVQVVEALAEEAQRVLGDVHRISFRTDLDPAAHTLTLRLGVELERAASFTAQSLMSRSKSARLPPPELWRLPPTTFSAISLSADDAARYEGIEGVLSNLIAGLLEFRGLNANQREAALAALTPLPVPATPLVVASGDAGEARAWHLLLLSSPGRPLRAEIAALLKAMTDPVLGPQMRRLLQPIAPGVVVRKVGRPPLRPALPKDSLYATLTVTPPDPNTQQAEDRGLLVVPDGDRTLIAFGPLEYPLGSLVTAVRTVPKEPAAVPTDLSRVANTPSIAGGYFTTRALLGTRLGAELARLLGRYTPVDWQGASSTLLRIPQRGTRPIPFVLTGDESKRVFTLELVLPEGALEDLAALVTLLGSQAS